MIDVKNILYDICEDERVYEEGIDLIDSGLLDSYAFIELFSTLEDYGVELQPTRIDKCILRSADKIQKLIDERKKVQN